MKQVLNFFIYHLKFPQIDLLLIQDDTLNYKFQQIKVSYEDR